jgi:hypothetical protein
MVGPRQRDGERQAGVRLQLDRGGRVENFSASAQLTEADTRRAPELVIGQQSGSIGWIAVRHRT